MEQTIVKDVTLDQDWVICASLVIHLHLVVCISVSKGYWAGPLALGAGAQALCLAVCCSPRIDRWDR